MRTYLLVAAVTLATSLACSGDDDEGGGAAGSSGSGGSEGTGGEAGAPVDPSGCDIPSPPELNTTESQTIGSGSSESCTEEIVRTVFESGGLIDFDCGDDPLTIPVTETLSVGADAHIDGGGRITFDGGGSVRILRTENSTAVILEGLSFVHGNAVAGIGEEQDGSGGAIHRGWQANLYIKDCHFSDNTSDGAEGFGGGAIFAGSAGWVTLVASTFDGNASRLGGGIHTILSDLTVVDSVFANNAAEEDGGAIFTDGGYVPYQGSNGAHDGVITLCGTKLLDNTAGTSAGAGFLYAYRDEASGKADRLIVNRTEFRGNEVSTTEPGLAGAIRIDAEAYVSNSLFVDNSTAGQGGAIWLGRGPATFENVTIYANHADLWGGAISYHTQDIRLTNCTVARNTAGEGSDALFGAEDIPPTVRNTIFYENGTSGSARHCRRPLQGENILVYPAEDDDRCEADLPSIDPLLASDLADNGGATETLALEDGSPALGQGTDCPTTDQRGEPRDTGTCDLGAFERE